MAKEKELNERVGFDFVFKRRAASRRALPSDRILRDEFERAAKLRHKVHIELGHYRRKFKDKRVVAPDDLSEAYSSMVKDYLSTSVVDDVESVFMACEVLGRLGFVELSFMLGEVLDRLAIDEAKKRKSTGRKSKISEEDKKTACEEVRAMMCRNEKRSLSDVCKYIADHDSRFSGKTLRRWLDTSEKIKCQT